MKRGDYLETRKGQLSLLRKRRLGRFHFHIAQQPQSKHPKSTDARQFQEKVLKTLQKTKRGSYRTDLILQIDFRPTDRNPPAIHTLAKNYLDLLKAPLEQTGIRRKHLLYIDDKFVKGLIVCYRLDPVPDRPSIVIKADTMTRLRSDLELVKRIESQDFQEDDRGWGFSRSLWQDRRDLRLFGHREEERADSTLEDLKELIRDKDLIVRHVGEEAYEAQFWFYRTEAQKAYLRMTDNFARRNLLSLLGRDRRMSQDAGYAKVIASIDREQRNWLMSDWFSIGIQHAPIRSGQKDTFREQARRAISAFKDKSPLLFPLSTLLSVTIFLVPPRGRIQDLDNLARLVIPHVHEILQPPSALVHTIKINRIRDPKLKKWYQEQKAALPKVPLHSITEYRVFEIPRFDGDPEEGMVRIALGDGTEAGKFWQDIDDLIDEWERQVE